MKTTLAVAALGLAALTLGIAGAHAVDARVAGALKTFEAIGTDAGKLQTFCAMSKSMTMASDEKDTARNEALDRDIEQHMTALGAEFQQAWDIGADLDPESEDGKLMNQALETLDGKCDK